MCCCAKRVIEVAEMRATGRERRRAARVRCAELQFVLFVCVYIYSGSGSSIGERLHPLFLARTSSPSPPLSPSAQHGRTTPSPLHHHRAAASFLLHQDNRETPLSCSAAFSSLLLSAPHQRPSPSSLAQQNQQITAARYPPIINYKIRPLRQRRRRRHLLREPQARARAQDIPGPRTPYPLPAAYLSPTYPYSLLFYFILFAFPNPEFCKANPTPNKFRQITALLQIFILKPTFTTHDITLPVK